jgi:transcriptional regulator GlxA family with amidase domain
LAVFYARWAFPPLTVFALIGDHLGMHTEILIYDGFDELDAIGPFEVLAAAGFDVSLVTADDAAPVETAHGATIVPRRRLSDSCDLLVVPGGSWGSRKPRGAWAEAQRGVVPGEIARRHAAGVRLASVCTGAMLLATAGLLKGRPATTHHSALDDLEAAGANVLRDARVVDDGDIVTSAGVTAGIDMALWLVEAERGAETAAAGERRIEHRRDRSVWHEAGS